MSAMNEINIAQTQAIPEVVSDSSTGTLRMTGDSYPENAFELFNGIIEWVEAFLAHSDKPLRLELHLVYMNTSSVRAMLDIFDLLEEAHKNGREVRVDWHYDKRNERIVQMAVEFREDCTFPFYITVDP